jgi:ribonuclease P protein component
MERLRKRADFLACQGGRRLASASFVLQARLRGGEGGPRLGFTVSRKNGDAVRRNRIRRRLKAAAATVDPPALPCDFVVVAKPAALTAPFEALKGELRHAVAEIVRRMATRPPAAAQSVTPAPKATEPTADEQQRG